MARPSETGSREPGLASRPGPTGIDPARVKEADSYNYGREFFGILNKSGQFWTVLAFDTPEKAHAHVRKFFWGGDGGETADWCKRNFRVIPVNVRLKAIAIETEGQDREAGLGAKHESAAIAQKDTQHESD